MEPTLARDRARPESRSHAISIEGLPVQVRDIARAIAPMAVYTRDVPLARTEWVPLDENPAKE